MRSNPNARMFKLPSGYTDVGWINGGPIEAWTACRAKGHTLETGIVSFDNSDFLNRGTDRIYTCNRCRICWHVDSSD